LNGFLTINQSEPIPKHNKNDRKQISRHKFKVENFLQYEGIKNNIKVSSTMNNNGCTIVFLLKTIMEQQALPSENQNDLKEMRLKSLVKYAKDISHVIGIT